MQGEVDCKNERRESQDASMQEKNPQNASFEIETYHLWFPLPFRPISVPSLHESSDPDPS